MRWLVLRSLTDPGRYCLHSEPRWEKMDDWDRRWWAIHKVCEDRAEANRVLDALVASGECRPFYFDAKKACELAASREGG